MPARATGGAVTVGTSAAPLRTDSVRPRHGVVLRGDPDNGGTVYVGFSEEVTTGTGFPLLAGESLNLEVEDLKQVYFIASEANQVIRWVAA